MNAYRSFWRRYFDFKGHSTRKEYWVPTLVNIVIMAILLVLIYASSKLVWLVNTLSGIVLIFVIAMIIPQIAVQVRRLHDINRKGFLVYLNLVLVLVESFLREGSVLATIINFIGLILGIWLFVYMCLGTREHVEKEERLWI
ncbi:DUF805 domain-containing protein [Staphylococcus pettenkoferi]|uniref:DUF805 domain-containing protein n=1 Tax=Staphylococcus pettenkoferi TaxID=170573 RepID=UPI00066D6E8B|nr:DUF805 domain-containing protein [Staphylococcus pettenkoferi]MCY1585305.1 DUF805 domain-containing protein [Staphylococcus pettenkoferi]MCY1627173.1 DUF805 domain-containing protein [Staphylococcus pettenkoferi]PNZ87501.1 DUF805 domain-containing protein [Staphylococcus pettenkoferi]QQC38355.1 DUF805 domain-containing protein [Staphylococcus pettenkoferi]UIK48965.1 DUF805 domain-containing protein [Staphylococcus pettenkoferi]